MAEWLLPWTKRGPSSAITDNFLWKHGRLYVMDNHRLALWCWWQHVRASQYWHYLHIDRHYDALWQTFNPWPEHSTEGHREDLNSFRAATLTDSGDTFALYRWDTITSALWSLHSEQLRSVMFATADEGDHPLIPRAEHINPWHLPRTMAILAEPVEHLESPCIVDIDIDYFTHGDVGGAFGQVFSDEYILELGHSLRGGLRTGRYGVVTIALSPETTGSWSLAERLLATLLTDIPEFSHFLAGAP